MPTREELIAAQQEQMKALSVAEAVSKQQVEAAEKAAKEYTDQQIISETKSYFPNGW